jgi:hypothetical protein
MEGKTLILAGERRGYNRSQRIGGAGMRRALLAPGATLLLVICGLFAACGLFAVCGQALAQGFPTKAAAETLKAERATIERVGLLAKTEGAR